MMVAILAIFYTSMVIAGYIIEFLFGGLGLVPAQRAAKIAEQGIQWNYTTVLNIIFLLLAAALLVRFFRSGAGPRLKMMGGRPDAHDHDEHHEHHEHGGAEAEPAHDARSARPAGPASARSSCGAPCPPSPAARSGMP